MYANARRTSDPRRGSLLLPAWTLFLVCLAGQAPAKAATIEPADAFSIDTLLYVEFNRPVERLDLLTNMRFWPEAEAMFRELAGLFPEEDAPPGAFFRSLAAFKEDPLLRRGLDTLVGDRLVVGVTAGEGLNRWKIVLLTRGKGPADPVEGLARVMERCFRASVERSGGKGERFRIRDGTGGTLLMGREASGWLVLHGPANAGEGEAAAAALSSRGVPRFAPLSASREFRQAMAGLPGAPFVRGFLNIPRIRERIRSRSEPTPCMALGMAEAVMRRFEGLGFAREVEPEGIRVFLTGRIIRCPGEDGVNEILDALSPIAEPLAGDLPASALATYEVGAPPGRCLAALGTLLKEGAPTLYQGLAMPPSLFEAMTGLSPSTDLFPFLGRSTAVAWLPPEALESAWPFPRITVLARVEKEDKVRSFLAAFFKWKADMVATLSAGLIQAGMVTETDEGVELTELRLEGGRMLTPPSPTFALTRGLLIFSPFRSAVRETVRALNGRSPTLSEEPPPVDPARAASPGAVERIHLNLKACEENKERLGHGAAVLLSWARAHRGIPFPPGADSDRLRRVGRALCRLLGRLERATGTTTLGEDGQFRFCLEWRPR